ncbi:MAG: lysophospholipid acyltransferase family protein [Bacteroidales bacterium]|nr:lysophospholipid acyltransferase family protein [Bacteroidales bacterium]
MIRAHHTRFHSWFFKWYSRLMIRSHFRGMHLHGSFQDNGNAVLVIGNHFSWWDGFFIVEVNRRLWQRRFHVMMLEEQLRKRMFLNKTGAFSVRKGHRSLSESLAYAGQLLSEPENLLLMFPQGAIQPHHNTSFTFERGLEAILKKVAVPPQIVFTAALVEYFSHRKPQLDIFIKKYSYKQIPTTQELQEQYNLFFAEALKKLDSTPE